MSEHQSQPHQTHEGPWRKINDYLVDEKQINEKYIGPSHAEHMDNLYGPANWKFDKTAYEERNARERLEAERVGRVATEAFGNLIAGRGYRLNDGTDVTGRATRRVSPPDYGDILISPDVEAVTHGPNRADRT